MSAKNPLIGRFFLAFGPCEKCGQSEFKNAGIIDEFIGEKYIVCRLQEIMSFSVMGEKVFPHKDLFDWLIFSDSGDYVDATRDILNDDSHWRRCEKYA